MTHNLLPDFDFTQLSSGEPRVIDFCSIFNTHTSNDIYVGDFVVPNSDFNQYRGDYFVEYDDGAELLLTDLLMRESLVKYSHSRKELHDFSWDVIRVYLERLSERTEIKSFTRDTLLLEIYYRLRFTTATQLMINRLLIPFTRSGMDFRVVIKMADTVNDEYITHKTTCCDTL